VPFTIVLILLICTMVNGTMLNFGKRYEDDLRVIFDQWPKLHLGLDTLSNQKILKGVYYISITYCLFGESLNFEIISMNTYTQLKDFQSLYTTNVEIVKGRLMVCLSLNSQAI
jgi:hypothetical protein